MRWYQPAISSVLSILGRQDPVPTISAAERSEGVRAAMLDLMFQAGVERQHPDLVIKISFATSIETLWYARCEVMAALSEALGEGRARHQLMAVSAMFCGLLPEARASRVTRRWH